MANEVRRPVDVADYLRRAKSVGCFICEFVARNRAFHHHEIYRDADAVVFLDKYQTVRGKTLVAPSRHLEDVTSSFTVDEYLRLQALVYNVAEAMRQVLPTERIYICSLGSREANSHVHWHVVPLPPGVPFERQQAQTLMLEHGVIPMDEQELAALAREIAGAMAPAPR